MTQKRSDGAVVERRGGVTLAFGGIRRRDPLVA
jgi:hypothetical protein